MIKKQFPDVCVPIDFVCDIFRRSKQKALSFPTFFSCTKNVFELVHMDIWGPTVISMSGYKYF